MRRNRHRDTKVWHDPLMTPAGRKRSARKPQTDNGDALHGDDGGGNGSAARAPRRRNGAKIIAGLSRHVDPREQERERLLHRVLAAEGRPSISSAANDFFDAGFELPSTQDVWLQLLEHNDESRVLQAIDRLSGLLGDEEPKRRRVLESRLRRIEEFADDPSAQKAAGALRRLISTKYAQTLT